MLKVHQSNTLENLFAAQNTLFDTPLVDPFSPEIILVQSQGMARWLALQTAGHRGIAANIDCLFPAAFVWRLVGLMTDEIREDPYEPNVLLWAVVSVLEAQLNTPAFEELKRYLAGPGSPLRLYQLAQKIAVQFDQYMVFRPDWINSWSSGAETHWQAVLWRAILTEFGDAHRVTQLTNLLERIDPSFLERARVPKRISLFGIPALPPSLFSVFSTLAEWIDVHLFILNPSKEYWADLLSPTEFVRLGVKADQQYDLSTDLHYETGNALLLNFGKMGRDFQLFLQQYDYEEENCFATVNSNTVLTALQSDILNAVETPGNIEREGVGELDCSVQCHAVHSPVREVEVLSDNLLAMFQNDPSLTAADILVMVPDIGRYAPLIEAVFGAMEGGRHITFTIADRNAVNSQDVVGAFVELLSLADSRLYASSVLDFLTKEPVRGRFAIKESDLDAIRNWLKEAGICWGMDGEHRNALGLPSEGHASWQKGLDRLLLGYALADSDAFFLDLLPVDLIEGSAGELLSRFLDFYGRLHDFIIVARHERSLADWVEVLLKVLDDLFGRDEGMGPDWVVDEAYSREKQVVRKALVSLGEAARVARFFGKVPLTIVQAALIEELEKGHVQSNFLSGGVTFCQMVPMRSVPFKVIALLGMNDGDFPRQDRPVGFDLMVDDFRLCDRCRRDDDRYLFLEALLSAREIFYLSYVGIGLRTNEISAPSVVVGELLDTLAKKYGMSLSEVSRRFTLFHPLHPFSARYFQGEKRLKHFSAMDYQIAEALGSDRPVPGLFAGPLAEQGSIVVSVAGFIDFFCHPVRYFLRNRLGLFLDDYYNGVVDRELFSLDSLAKYSVMDKVLTLGLEGSDIDFEHYGRRLQENGEIPAGVMGRYVFGAVEQTTTSLVESLLRQQNGTPLEPLAIDLDLGSIKVTGLLTNLRPSGQYLARPSKMANMNYRDYVRFWLSHLFLNAGRAKGDQHSFHLFLDGQKEYQPISDALVKLRELAQLFVLGMRTPLPLFPKSTMQFVKQNWPKKEESSPERTSKALAVAQNMWQEGDFYNGPEREEPYFWAAFGSNDPFEMESKAGCNFINTTEIVMKEAYLTALVDG